MALGYNTTLRNDRLDLITADIDAGAGAGTIKIYAGTQPATGEDASPSAWQASTAYVVGDTVEPTTANTYYYRATVAGTTAASEPTWPTSAGTVTDGGVTWEFVGTVATLLSTGTFSDPSAPAASAGVLTFSSITYTNAAADGTATWARAADSDGNFVFDADVGETGSGAAVILNETAMLTGGPVNHVSATITTGNA